MMRVDGAERELDAGLRRLRERARAVPSKREIADDLGNPPRASVVWMVARPWVCATVFAVVSPRHLVFAIFAAAAVALTTIAVMHDLLHSSLGLRRRTNDVLLAMSAALIFESGHALQRTHRAHHRWFPDVERDPEASFARGGISQALFQGPVYRYRLWWWAWRHHPEARSWLAIEGAWHVAALGLAMSGQSSLWTGYVTLMLLGSWWFPLISVLVVHDVSATTPTRWTRSLHSAVIERLIFNQGYHLEHHLWPTVPSRHLPELARRARLLLEAEHAPIRHLAPRRRHGRSRPPRHLLRSGEWRSLPS